MELVKIVECFDQKLFKQPLLYIIASDKIHAVAFFTKGVSLLGRTNSSSLEIIGKIETAR